MSHRLQGALSRARLRVLLIVTLTSLLWIGLFKLFADGFRFLAMVIPDEATQDETTRAIFNVFFLSLTAMLLVSTGIIVYGLLFRSDEVRFLLATPARVERVFIHKFDEAMLFSSWGFVLMGSPMLVAYGVGEDAGLSYYLTLLPFLASFALVPGGLGAIGCIWLVGRLPRWRRKLVWVFAAASVLALVWFIRAVTSGGDDLLTPGWFQETIARLRYSENRLLPSWWLSTGLLESVRGGLGNDEGRLALRESLAFLAVTVANALFLREIAIFVAARRFRESWSALHTERRQRKRVGLAWIDRASSIVTWPLSPRMRLLILKDLRLFRRDPLQWTQFLIFFGLLVLYALNMRRLVYDTSYLGWVNIIGFVNLAVVGLMLSAFTTRFVFPMISLEGRRFWILGLLPLRRESILWSKYLFVFVASLAPCSLLIALSDFMLRVPGFVGVLHALLLVSICSGLSAIAVGLGAKMPNLREDSPSRIAAGFGGTLNLVLSTAFIAASILATAIPCHRFLVGRSAIPSPDSDPNYPVGMVIAGAAFSVALGLASTVAPLKLGFKAFRELEF